MADTIYLEYTIYLTDKEQVSELQAQYPNGLRMAPDDANIAYDANFLLDSADFVAPCIKSPYFQLVGSGNYPTNEASFTRKVGGWFGIGFLFGTTKTFRWVGSFAYVAGAAGEIGGTPTEVVAIAQQKAIVSFDIPPAGEHVNLGSDYNVLSRDASRHVDGYGYAFRDQGDEVQIVQNAHRAATADTWERFYFRPRNAPTLGPGTIWRCGTSTNGALLKYTTDGHLALYGRTASVESLMATSSDTYPIGTWKKIDIILHVAAASGGYIEVYVNRLKVIGRVNFAASQGLSAVGATHTTSFLGGGGVATDTFECDLDDYRSADHPTVDSGGRYAGIDWLNGTKIQKVNVDALASGNGWTGDYRYLQQHIDAFHKTSAAVLTTTTSADALFLSMRTREIGAVNGAIGPVGMLAAWYIQQIGSIAGSAATFGWKYDGTQDLSAIALTVNATAWITRALFPSGATAPIANFTPLELHHIKYGNVSAANCWAACALVDLVGTFGEEDVPESADEPIDPATFPARRGIHASAYPETPWASASIPPISAVIVHSGTYAGNDTVQELQFKTPVTWLVIKRENATGAAGVFWHTGQVGAHSGSTRDTVPTVRGMIDPSFTPTGVEDDPEMRTIVRIVGADAALNASGSTYNYIAFCDPGARFSMNGGISHGSAVSSFVNELRNGQFLAELIMAQVERVGSSDSTVSLYIAGPGTVGTAGTLITGSTPASIGTIAEGEFTSVAGLVHSDSDTTGYAGWRSDDNSSDPNKNKVLRVGTYTGDGAASRTISWAPSGLRPLYAIVAPANAASFHRTPSNTGTTSHNMSTGASIAATGITAGGIDQMTVGSLGNVNGIVYNYFVILGSATAGNGGWSIDGEFAYVEPDTPADTDEYDDPTTSEEPETPVDPDPDPGPDDTDDCAAGTVCVEATTRIANLALLEIGVTKILDNYCTSDSKEAAIIREVYEQCVRHTLIAYPWPFATEYATLALIATQPSANNEDWDFAYRMPSDCIFPRRFVVDRGTAVDPAPPPMGLSSDDSGGIIFGNEADALLEYTKRPACVGYNGDDLFIEALKWRLAAALAPPLTRIPGEADRCLKMFEIIIQKAEATIKQGQPGLRGAASAVDTTAAAIAANVQVVNRALVRIGAPTIANMTTEQSRSAVAAALVFEDELRSTLRDYPWSFATAYADPMTLVDGADSDPATPDWTFSHRLPTDVVFVRRIVKVDADWADGAPRGSVGRSFDPSPYPYRLAADATGGLLYSNVEEPVIEYTARPNNILAFADPVFRDALAWRLAATLAPSLAVVDPHRPEQHGRGPETPQDPTRRNQMRWSEHQQRVRVAQWAWAMYQRALAAAEATDHNESEPEPHGDAEWIRNRQ